MTQSADVSHILSFLERVSRRLSWLAAARGATVGLALALDLALVIAIARWPRDPHETLATAVWLGAMGFALGVIVPVLRRHSAAPVAIEKRVPDCRNVVITAAELIDDPARVHPYVAETVWREAANKMSAMQPALLFPAARIAAAFVAMLGIWTLSVGVVAARERTTGPWTGVASSLAPGTDVIGIEILVIPPLYTGRPPQRLRDPARIEALAGSRLQVTVRTDADAVSVETVAGRRPLGAARSAQSEYGGELIADADGFLAIETSRGGQAGVRRLIGLSVTPDHSPRVKIGTPGKDMFLADVKRNIDVGIEADDDLALSSLTLRYTKVSGSGERFTFVEGEVPVAVARSNDRSWQARGALPLQAMALERGDMVVYRAIATDKRPGAVPTESDAFIVEITSPGMLAAEGFSLDDQQDKYALSQQMVILKTERLIARAAGLSPESLTYHSQLIAAEQRSVRAEFVFMMGGEVAEEVIAAANLADINEEAEAANEADLGAGRMVNRGRVALVQAIRLMSRASTQLNNADPLKALPEERAALVSLQQAFSRTRYLLRALTQRERLDLSRRLTGVLTTATRDVRPVAEPAVDARVVAIRRALAGIATIAGASRLDRNAAANVALLAQRVLEVDPSADSLQRTATDLSRAAAAIGRDRQEDARRLLDAAATRLTLVLRSGLLTGPSDPALGELNQLAGELSDALRRARGGR